MKFCLDLEDELRKGQQIQGVAQMTNLPKKRSLQEALNKKYEEVKSWSAWKRQLANNEEFVSERTPTSSSGSTQSHQTTSSNSDELEN
jgi:hypothetical protein